jgi:hypothetical protein
MRLSKSKTLMFQPQTDRKLKITVQYNVPYIFGGKSVAPAVSVMIDTAVLKQGSRHWHRCSHASSSLAFFIVCYMTVGPYMQFV